MLSFILTQQGSDKVQFKSQFCMPTTWRVTNLRLNTANNECGRFAFKHVDYITNE